ncbi:MULTISPECIES: xylose isomerase [Priestia]|jgi:xylose isomerase|uniref:Xylose isomerase n=4 Tax=Priestia TaxID=2800373 RepID=D5DPH2_PRIM1|nr:MULTISPECIES: xylose isomerase [Priestia]AVX07950.1 xylose isomerase [Bacillus sp. Y-01]KOP74101.1 xylose isomerase [Bacillus sp. FJAT-21351]KQU25782.1 xylose isomerase [Bacillus sp. Leaf75]KRF53770.1 xylose isomerase [Bacillus sp. Soil531]MBZ5480650.1 xylose isomerase [Bacillus sp. T_4]MCF6795760.1 xylose isomerase [Bacillus sp. ET1]MDH6655161.1 xylose isomerase [Bacillus sp. PvP124]MDP9574719.1 xylose isomerase [Bacillus sp. 1751]MEB2276416.1 xylose isomerase [Bacillus sp. ILBB4]RFB3
MVQTSTNKINYFESANKVLYEGKDSKNPLAFKYYNPDEVVGGKTMKDQLRFSVAYWHTFTADGTDPFGAATMQRSWDRYDGMDLAKARVEAAFQLFETLNVPFFAFHDRDVAPEGSTLQETNKNLDVIVTMIKEYMQTSNVKLLWNTANMFTNPRFVHGAATSCNADVFAYAAAQVKKGLETAKELGAENYVFWGGREGYETLLNTNLQLELDNLARFMYMAVDYATEIGYTGQFLIEPKPKEPTTHQYDTDAATTISFLRQYGLDKYFKLNLEANHATLAGHTFEHELRVARVQGLLGSVDANQGDPLLGWDTDEFPTDLYSTTLAMYEILQNGGLGSGGLNFDAKVRRGSFEQDDLLYAHVAGMDAFARGLKVAHKLVEDRVFENVINERYSSFKEGIGLEIVEGKANFHTLEQYAFKNPNIVNKSGRQERLKAILNQYILEV